MSKVILVPFRGDPLCFIHVLLNLHDLVEKGFEARLLLEGEATKLIPDLEKEDFFLHHLWLEARKAGLIEGVCKACATKMGTIKEAQRIGLKCLDEMKGHPSLARYLKEGYQILIF